MKSLKLWGVLLFICAFSKCKAAGVGDLRANSSTTPRTESAANGSETTVNTMKTSNAQPKPTYITTQSPTTNSTHSLSTPKPTTHATNSTPTPTTANHTTASHNSTTHTTHPSTVTTVTPTPTYSPAPSPPTTGNYSVSNKEGANCIMALMGLELILHGPKDSYFNMVPKDTNATGNCYVSSASLDLDFKEGSVHFNFVKNDKTFFVDFIEARLSPMEAQQISKQTLMQTSLGSSYKCRSQQTIDLGKNMTLLMVNVKLQAFSIENNRFGEESLCASDHNKMIAMAVGITVVIIIVLALILYFIFRGRKSAGYQRI